MGVTSLSFLEDTVSQKMSQSSDPFSVEFYEPLVQGLCCREVEWSWSAHGQLLVVSYNGLCLLQKGVSLLRGESRTCLRYRDKQSEYS